MASTEPSSKRDSALSSSTANSSGVGQDMATSVWSNPSPTISTSSKPQDPRARAYRKQMRKEAQAREREQYAALSDSRHGQPVAEARLHARGEEQAQPGTTTTNESNSGFSKLIRKMGLKKSQA